MLLRIVFYVLLFIRKVKKKDRIKHLATMVRYEDEPKLRQLSLKIKEKNQKKDDKTEKK